MNLKKLVKPFVPKIIGHIQYLLKATRPLSLRSCPICGYHGYFAVAGTPPRRDALCPSCGALERHRLFWSWFKGDKSKLDEPILHFSPERALEQAFRKVYEKYSTADLHLGADLKLDIECIDLPAGSVNTVVCNHVLEHVSDRKALKEIFRVLSDHGRLVVSVPLVAGWEHTYENENVSSPAERELHFAQNDGLRLYGRDFKNRLRDAGFVRVDEVTAEGQSVVDYSLEAGKKFFLCSKS